MPHDNGDNPQSVLIIDHSDDSREVLRTVLQRRGLQILESDEAGHGLEMARRHHPDLIVMDLEDLPGSDPSLCDTFAHETQQNHASLLLLGSVSRTQLGLVPPQYVRKPYHYAPLIRKIETLLELSSAGRHS